MEANHDKEAAFGVWRAGDAGGGSAAKNSVFAKARPKLLRADLSLTAGVSGARGIAPSRRLLSNGSADRPGCPLQERGQQALSLKAVWTTPGTSPEAELAAFSAAMHPIPCRARTAMRRP